MQQKYQSTTMEKKERNIRQISEPYASLPPEKAVLEVMKLFLDGYTEIEATALVGMETTPITKKSMLNEPIYYASKEEIQLLKEQRDQRIHTLATPVRSSTPNNHTTQRSITEPLSAESEQKVSGTPGITNEKPSVPTKKERKKKVTWNDGKTEGQIEKGYVTSEDANSLKKAKIVEQFEKLVSEGYTKIEAAALTGKSVLKEKGKNAESFWNEPIFYASKEEIRESKRLRDKFASKVKPSTSNIKADQLIQKILSEEKTVTPTTMTLPGESTQPLSSEDAEEVSTTLGRSTEQSVSSVSPEKEENRYSFFNSTTVGIAALAVVATIGFVASRK
ncbi:TPA: hypothetical protein ACTXXA_000282 [Legionella anisa]